ncbi:macro domain-containing protein [Indiicoccus explosivorum]|uniref:macro domain-containing protein n=1 Tax=Indiicoccus explosivorum TaxID=1917864 RepID=UPI000B43AB00|nr:macro domain-containing protein [Indiicoccus explosivorum]
MITYVKKDLFESPAQVLVNTVNTVGVMGKGIAKRFKEIYPDMFEQYRDLCEKNLFNTGQLWIYKTPHKWILNFPTKQHWKSPSKIEYIEAGLKKFVETYEEKGITSISFPLLGCGNGGLDWEQEVKPLMEKYLRPLPIEIYIHLSDKSVSPEHKRTKEIKEWLQSMPQVLSFNEVWEDVLALITKRETVKYNNKNWRVIVINLEKEEQNFFPEVESNDDISAIPTIAFSSESKEYFVTKLQLAGFWRFLRKNGFASLQDLPEGLTNVSGLVLSLFNQLDYVETVAISHSYRTETDFTNGIRLIPQPFNRLKLGKEEDFYELKK